MFNDLIEVLENELSDLEKKEQPTFFDLQRIHVLREELTELYIYAS